MSASHVDVHQKPTQYCKAIILHLKTIFKTETQTTENKDKSLSWIYFESIADWFWRWFRCGIQEKKGSPWWLHDLGPDLKEWSFHSLIWKSSWEKKKTNKSLDLNFLIHESVDGYVDISWAIGYMNLESKRWFCLQLQTMRSSVYKWHLKP